MKAKADAGRAANAAANRSLGAQTDGTGGQDPQAAAMSAAAEAAAALGIKLEGPGQVNRAEAQAMAEAVASATAERLGIPVAIRGKLSRAEADQALGKALSIETDATSLQQAQAGRREQAEAAEAFAVESFEQDAVAVADELARRADELRAELPIQARPKPVEDRLSAIRTATELIMDRLGYPSPPGQRRREADAALPRRKRADTAPTLTRRQAQDNLRSQRPRSITL